jgi:low affinity Fe/Cu permease
MEFPYFINFLHIKLDEFIEEYNNSNTEDNYITIKNIGNKEIIKSIDLFQLNKFDDLYKEYIELNNQLTEIESKIKLTINENN